MDRKRMNFATSSNYRMTWQSLKLWKIVGSFHNWKTQKQDLLLGSNNSDQTFCMISPTWLVLGYFGEPDCGFDKITWIHKNKKSLYFSLTPNPRIGWFTVKSLPFSVLSGRLRFRQKSKNIASDVTVTSQLGLRKLNFICR